MTQAVLQAPKADPASQGQPPQHDPHCSAGEPSRSAVGSLFAPLRNGLQWLRQAVMRKDHRPSDSTPTSPLPANDTGQGGLHDMDTLVERMIRQGRYTFLLRPQIAKNLSPSHLRQALDALEESMALVPDGEVLLGWVDPARQPGWFLDQEDESPDRCVFRVRRFFLDRYPVTNRQFHQFVVAGGYEQMNLWDEQIWPAMLEFVDQTGCQGPRWWKDGCYEPGKEDHPVVGVCWYEAVAYARWAGKRLPSDAEWVKAASWPVTLSDGSRLQRNFPWGDTMDHGRANVWGSGHGDTLPVDALPEGVSVGGVYQLTGNVWEWLHGDFPGPGFPFKDLELQVPMKSIRGGAFDTYFDIQAGCHFQSGEIPLARRANIGFRCAISAGDLMLAVGLDPGVQTATASESAASGTPDGNTS